MEERKEGKSSENERLLSLAKETEKEKKRREPNISSAFAADIDDADIIGIL